MTFELIDGHDYGEPKINIQIVRARPEEDADIPFPMYQTPGSAAMDLFATIKKEVSIEPNDVLLIPSGFKIAIPPGYCGRILPRSGSAKEGLILLFDGLIDSDFRGEMMIPLFNISSIPQRILRKDRIAQLLIQPCMNCLWHPTDSLPETRRGEGGFGSTGKREDKNMTKQFKHPFPKQIRIDLGTRTITWERFKEVIEKHGGIKDNQEVGAIFYLRFPEQYEDERAVFILPESDEHGFCVFDSDHFDDTLTKTQADSKNP